MEKMNSNELENELMEVTGGAAETDLVPVKEKSSELIPKPDSETITCIVCNKKYPSAAGEVPKGYNYVCNKCRECMRKELPSQITK